MLLIRSQMQKSKEEVKEEEEEIINSYTINNGFEPKKKEKSWILNLATAQLRLQT